MPQVEARPLQFQEAMDYFRERYPERERLEFAATYATAFQVAGVTRLDILDGIRAEVDSAIANGTTLATFQANVNELLATKGWAQREGEVPLSPWRLETIFRTNVQTALNAGRYQQMRENISRRPYWEYQAIKDSRTRPDHAAHDGEIYPADDPFWDHWFPPNDYNCRCSVRALTAEDVRGRDEALSASTENDYNELTVPAFDGNPGAVKWQADLSRLSPEARALAQGLGPCETPAAVAERLTRLTDGLVDSGIPTTVAPINIVSQQLKDDARGRAIYSTGEIALRPDLYSALESSLAAGTASQEEMGSYFTLTHEFGHQVGLPATTALLADPGNQALYEAVNELWARNAAPTVMQTLGVKYQPRELTAYINTRAYPMETTRLQGVLSAAGLSSAEQYQFVAQLNYNQDPADFSDQVWQLLKTKKGVSGSGDFGRVLLERKRFDQLIDELNHSPSR